MTFQHKRLVLAFSLPLMISAAALIGLPTAAFGQSPAEEDKEVLYWYDPMVPQQKFDKPGKSPFMDMELIPRYADEGSDGASISIDPSVTQNLGVRLATVTRESISQSLEATGALMFDERDVAVVQARAGGFVERVYDRAPEDVIEKGAPLADLLVPEWAAAQEEYLALKGVGQPQLLAAARQRLRLAGMPPEVIVQLERTGIDRVAAARYGLNIADVQSIVAGAIGGQTIGETVEGLARYPINLRYGREWRDSISDLRNLPIYTPQGSQITLGTVAKVQVTDGPPMLKSENARLSGWVYVDVRGRDMAAVVGDLREKISKGVQLESGMSISYSGQFEFMERANAKLKLVVPATLLIIFVLLYLTFARFGEALLIMATLPFALTGGVWFLYLLGYNLSVATGIGFIALAGVSAEFGVIMLLYLKNAWTDRVNAGAHGEGVLLDAIREGAVQRVRPKAMTVAVIIAGLLPILWGGGTGSEIMSRIAAPMVGGMITAPLLSLFVLPAAYLLMRRRQLQAQHATKPTGEHP